MNIVLRVIIDILILGGVFFSLVGVVGILRMPDTYCRMQASTCVATLGMIFAALGALLYAIIVERNGAMAVKIAVVAAFVLLTNPVVGHALAKGAYKHGIRPKRKMVIDDFGEDAPHE